MVRRLIGFLSVLIVVGLILGVVGVGGVSVAEEFSGTEGEGVLAEEGFFDVDGADVHGPAVERLAIEGVFAGTECAEGEFCPNDPVERWVVAVWLLRVLEEGVPLGVEFSRYGDVDASEWWARYVERLGVLGVGLECAVGAARFCPTEPITREEVASVLVRAFEVDPGRWGVFVDVEGDSPHAADIDALGAVGVTVGCAVGPVRFCPLRNTSRGEMATLLVRALQLDAVLSPSEQFAEVTVGTSHSCGLRTDGRVVCWGSGDYGQLGAPEGEFRAVAAGGWHSCGIRAGGGVVCWGSGDYGQLDAPEGEFRAVAAGGWHSCGIRAGGGVVCWGSGDYGQLDAPEGEFRAVAAGGWHSCGIRAGGGVVCWGSGDYGQLDAPEGEFRAVAAGGWHSCGLRTDGLVSCWGRNGWGESAPPARRFRAVAAGPYLGCGLRADHAVACWGAGSGRAYPPEGKFVSVSAGFEHSCGVRVDGTIMCWGGEFPQAPVGVEGYVPADQADPGLCRPGGPAGFPRPEWAGRSVGTVRVAVLFVDFSDAPAAHTTGEEAELGLPFMKKYLETVSYGRLDLEFEPLHRWLRAEESYLHYIEPGAFEVGDRIHQEAVRLADAEFDFVGFDTVMVVLPGSFFYSGVARGSVSTDEGVVDNTIRINAYPLGWSGQPRPWGLVAAQKTVANFGLVDLYPYNRDRHRHPPPPSDQMWINHQFGLMGLWAFFSAPERDTRLRYVWHYPSGWQTGGYARHLHAAEMLAWSRWRLGWLDAAQVHCVTEPRTTFTLRPVAFPGEGIVMVAVPLSETEVMVIESRRRLGYDHGNPYVVPDGPRTVLPSLAGEGVLVYTVDAALGSGSVPIEVGGVRNGHFAHYPVLTEGQSITLRGYTITVDAATYETHTVTVIKEGSS